MAQRTARLVERALEGRAEISRIYALFRWPVEHVGEQEDALVVGDVSALAVEAVDAVGGAQPLHVEALITRQVHALRRLCFFQAEDGIRDGRVTGVQTCALPI